MVTNRDKDKEREGGGVVTNRDKDREREGRGGY